MVNMEWCSMAGQWRSQIGVMDVGHGWTIGVLGAWAGMETGEGDFIFQERIDLLYTAACF